MSKLATISQEEIAADIHLPRLRWYWDFGLNLSEPETRKLLTLLVALFDTTALREAALKAGMSYRTAWGLLRRCEEELGMTMVTMQRGRGTQLTPLGESLVELDAAARLALGEGHSAWEGRMRSLIEPLRRPVTTSPNRLCVLGSHDIALADWVEHGRQVPIDMIWRGSEDALSALGRGECDAAGFHIPDTWGSDRFSAWLSQWLDPRLHVCIPVMWRQQGLLVRSGNPLQLESLMDVVERGACFVNRQRGSGTRRLIDEMLDKRNIDRGRLLGYGREEFTHDAIAATIASGQADAGIALKAVAYRYDIDFVPLVRERYGFAMRRSSLTSPQVKTLLQRLRGGTFRNRLHALPGYEPMSEVSPLDWDSWIKKTQG
ncbi:Molybdate transport repressor ModE-like protein [Georgfuchsia toluolica]|uniref:Molybdate transport repressor ModE-like protein n=1 Tax=Georgfuchsia toluolica TaxID=424218 RepID=A0A916N8E7_9PROT|nr:substrate-binding domain-containing protein [Georgfuchsia toluolica]CAG4883182.1 Molybdate transport repressor ModE-like protein [Georgfuchsia toluolica]